MDSVNSALILWGRQVQKWVTMVEKPDARGTGLLEPGSTREFTLERVMEDVHMSCF